MGNKLAVVKNNIHEANRLAKQYESLGIKQLVHENNNKESYIREKKTIEKQQHLLIQFQL